MTFLAPSRLPIARHSAPERSSPTVTAYPQMDVPMPHSPDAEKCVIGSILINNRVFFRVPNLTREHFFVPANRIIFAVAKQMVEEGEGDEIEPLSVKLELVRRGLLDDAGGGAYVSSLLDMVPDIANVERYAKIIERMAGKRAAIKTGYAMVTDSLDPETEPEEVAAAAMAALSPVATREEQQARPLVEVLSEAFEKQRALATANRSIAMDCGFPTLVSHKIFFPTLIVCSADRGLGKSALMVQWARNLAANGHANAIFSLESAPHDIGLRYASMTTGIPHGYVRDFRTLSDSNKDRLAECLREASGLGIHIAKGPRTVEGIILEIRRLKAMHGIQAAFVDYFQLLSMSKRFERHELMMGEIAQTLLAAAIDNDVAICAFSQVNREGGVAYADSIEKSARVRLHFDRPNKGCRVDFAIIKNNEERTNDFEAHFCEVRQQWGEGNCEQNNCRSLRNVAAERRLFT
jgi:replicative DNA helicase